MIEYKKTIYYNLWRIVVLIIYNLKLEERIGKSGDNYYWQMGNSTGICLSREVKNLI